MEGMVAKQVHIRVQDKGVMRTPAVVLRVSLTKKAAW